MILLPAIDLRGGQCVRLLRGEFETARKVANSAMETAKAFYHAGARWVHMVDLDGARDGGRPNFPIAAQVAAESGLCVQLGGGIKTTRDVDACFAGGIARVVIGSAAVTNPEVVEYAVARYGDRVAVGIDARGGVVKTHGWEKDAGLDYLAFAKTMARMGIKTLIFTDIETDGALAGPSLTRLAALQEAVSCNIIASGGVSCMEDIMQLRDMGLYGAIVGMAYYTGRIDLAAAIKEGGKQVC